MDDIKILTPQMKYYYKNKDKINQKQCDKYRNNEEFKNITDERRKEVYQKYKKDYIKKDTIRSIERYKTDEEYRQKKLNYAKKYRELQKLKKLN